MNLKAESQYALQNVRVRDRAEIGARIVAVAGDERSIGSRGQDLSDHLSVAVQLEVLRVRRENVANEQGENFEALICRRRR